MNLENDMYNLGDMIRFKQIHGLNLNLKGTIGYEYLVKQGPPYYILPHKKRFFKGWHKQLSEQYPNISNPLKCAKTFEVDPCEIDYKCLLDIVKKRCSRIADEDTFAIHIRVFDAINQKGTPDLDTFIKIIKKYNLHTRFKNCLLFYGNHKSFIKTDLIDKSNNYLETLKNKIEELNLTCKFVSRGVDEDFISLATAKCYVAGYKGFGFLAASINPNEVIWDIQNPPKFPWEYKPLRKYLIKGYEFYNKNKL